MSLTFTKLFTSITESTIWQEDDHTRIVWITMLAMADRNGRVFASIPGLASRAIVPLQSVEAALRRFLSPDKYSRTTDYEGRRIEIIDGGWRLLNHSKYREIRDDEAIKASKRKYINERRRKEREARMTGEDQRVEKVDRSRHNAEAATDAASESEAFERKNERTQNVKVLKATFPKIPRDLAAYSDFVEAWESHLENLPILKGHSEAITLAKRQLGLCKRWLKERGIDEVLAILDGALSQGSAFLLDEGNPGEGKSEGK